MEPKIKELLNLLEKYENGALADPKDGPAFEEYAKNDFFNSYFFYKDMKLRMRLTKKGNDWLLGLKRQEEKENMICICEELVIFLGAKDELIGA